MKFFSYESKFSQLLLKLCNACMLNVLWFLCSLPIVTMGAATTALYYACLKIVREEDSHVAAQFFRSFRQNFRQATQIWLILLGCGLFLGLDGYILCRLRLTSGGTMGVIWTLALAAVIAFGTRYVCLAAPSVSVIFPLTYYWRTGLLASALILLAVAVPVFAKHWENFRRIRTGEEMRTSFIWDKEGELKRIGKWNPKTESQLDRRGR